MKLRTKQLLMIFFDYIMLLWLVKVFLDLIIYMLLSSKILDFGWWVLIPIGIGYYMVSLNKDIKKLKLWDYMITL